MARTVVESPQSKLRRELGLSERTGPTRTRVNDWIGFNCGDHVCRIDDSRHVGRVEEIHHGAYLTVRWLDNGWYEKLELAEVKRCIT